MQSPTTQRRPKNQRSGLPVLPGAHHALRARVPRPASPPHGRSAPMPRLAAPRWPQRLSSQKNRDFGAAVGIAGGEQYLCVTAELCDYHPMTHALQPVDEHPAEWCILADHDDGATSHSFSGGRAHRDAAHSPRMLRWATGRSPTLHRHRHKILQPSVRPAIPRASATAIRRSPSDPSPTNPRFDRTQCPK